MSRPIPSSGSVLSFGFEIASQPVPDIDWDKTFGALGLHSQFRQYLRKNPASLYDQLWTAPVLQGLTIKMMVEAYRRAGVPVMCDIADLDAQVQNDRDPSNGSYSLSFKATIEADPENAGVSAWNLRELNREGCTVLERHLIGYGYFQTTGTHLDHSGTSTLCPGSKDNKGRILNVGYTHPDHTPGHGHIEGGIGITLYCPEHAHQSARARTVYPVPA